MSEDRNELVLSVEGLGKRYGSSLIFEKISLTVKAGEFVAIMGESGVGKSTLLHCIAGLEDWESGTVQIRGVDLGQLDADARALLRRERLGFVFQAFHLLPHLDLQQNVALPLMLLQRSDPARIEQALLEVDLLAHRHQLPQQLSGGQMQRAAIARALIHRPALLLADEPTGNLDPDNAAIVMDLMIAQARDHGAALVLVTHSQLAAARADRILRMCSDGLRP